LSVQLKKQTRKNTLATTPNILYTGVPSAMRESVMTSILYNVYQGYGEITRYEPATASNSSDAHEFITFDRWLL